MVKNLPAKAGVLRHVDLIPRWGRSPVGRYDNPLQYPCLESPMNRACIYQSCSSNLPHYSLPLGNHKFIFYIKRSLLWTQVQFSSVQLLSCVQLFVTPWTAAHQAYLSITNYWSLLKLMFIESVMPSNHLIPFSSFSIFPSIRVFLNESTLSSGGQSIGVSASISVLPMNTQD